MNSANFLQAVINARTGPQAANIDATAKAIREKAVALFDKEKTDSEAAMIRDKNIMSGMMDSLKEINCKFCRGWGHRAKQCRTLQTLNQTASKTPGMKQAWGKMKSEYLGTAFKKICFRSRLKRKRLAKAFLKGLEDEDTSIPDIPPMKQ